MPESIELNSVNDHKEWYRKTFFLMIGMLIVSILIGVAGMFMHSVYTCSIDFQKDAFVVDKLSDSLNERYITMQTWITGFFPTMALFGWFILTTYLYVFKEHGEIKILNIPILTHTQIIMLCLIGIKTWYVVTYLAAMISGGCK
jgi:hypothetical protein